MLRTLTSVLGALLASGAFAQSQYPTRPLHLVVGFAPGGASDIISRAMSEPLSRSFGQPIIVDNKPGAGSSLAAELVAKSATDGYTVMIASPSAVFVNPIIMKNINYVTERDFVPVTLVTTSPLVVAVHPSVPANSLRELIDYAKKNPGKLNFATSGNGSAPHLGTVLLASLTGIQMVHVPYKSGGLAVQSVLAGDTQLTIATPPSVLPQVKAGRLRGLAMTSAERSPLVPELPGMKEAGVDGYNYTFWYGMFAPAGTPRAVINRLFDATVTALRDERLKKILATDGTETAPSKSPEDFAAWLREEGKLWAKLVKESGAKVD
jgi:tripartite-type tricarboxylate transporter receptor subunit TctC